MLVTFRTTTEGATLHIDGPNVSAGDRDCSSACTLSIAPGNYTVDLSTSGKTKSFPLLLREPSEVVVSAGSPFARGFGLGLIIVGGVAASWGIYAFSHDQSQKAADAANPDFTYHSPGWVVPLEVLGAVGLAGALVGVGLFVSGQPKAKVTPRPAETAQRRTKTPRRSRFTFTPAVVARGGGLRVGFSF